jgi:hypothetical protein
MMNSANLAQTTETQYEAPVVEFVGLAENVVLGVPGAGFDGPYGMLDPEFEFEADAQ